MAKSIYEFTHYRDYLEQRLDERGAKKEFADFIGCQTTFLSNVLAKHSNLSLEHAMSACEFCEFNEKETHYFMLMVQYEKAGSNELEGYFLKQIRAAQAENKKISNRIAEHQTITADDQLRFYHSWLYAAIHVLTAVKTYQSRRAIREHLKLPSSEVDPCIDFMIRLGVLTENEGVLKSGSTRIHLPKGSPFLQKHHLNWRMKTMQSLDFERENDLHYTMVMSLSKKDVQRMQEILLESVSKTDQLLKETGDEVVYSLCMDWFKI